MSSSFDRVRPRTPRPPAAAGPLSHDAEGKRALFSSGEDSGRPSMGSALVECSRCDARTVLAPGRAVRAALPSLHLALRVGHGRDVRIFGPLRRLHADYPTYMKCPACHRPSWVRFTVQV